MTRHPLLERVTAAMTAATVTLGRDPAHGEVAEVAGFTCVDTGLGVSRANVALPGPSIPRPLPALREVAAWFGGRGLNFRVDLPSHSPSDLMAAAMTLGLEFWERQPLMLLDGAWPESHPGDLGVRQVATDADVEAFCSIDALEYEDQPLYPSIVAAVRSEPPVRLFTGFIDGAPVARIAAMLHGELVTLHSLYVHPAYRGRGLGTEMTLAALAAARAERATTAALASTVAAASLYERLGFCVLWDIIVMGTDVPLA
jgi:ribosomal protein S18 acetylase RimI-like enzyme